MNLKYIKELAEEQMMQRRSHPNVELGNKYYHGLRVANTVVELREQLFPDYPEWDDVLRVAAWFHDIANDRSNPEIDHQIAGAQMTASVLKDVCLPDEIEQITALIRTHDTRYPDRIESSDKEKLLQDADLLDHIGIFDIWYAFSMAYRNGMSMPELFEWFEKTRPGRDKHFYYGCNFELSRKILLEKCRFVYEFGKRYLVEGSGHIWNLEKLAEEWKETDGGVMYGDFPSDMESGSIWK